MYYHHGYCFTKTCVNDDAGGTWITTSVAMMNTPRHIFIRILVQQ